MKIYTKTGDKGDTSLYGGKRIPKYDNVIHAIGDVDELNSVMGIILNLLENRKLLDLSDKVIQIQKELFMVGSDLATPADANQSLHIVRIGPISTARLENDIDEWDDIIPKLNNFVLPGGSQDALFAYYARAICRRCERGVALLNKNENRYFEIMQYLNRLSDWLFMLFRLLNYKLSYKEKLWNS